MHFSLLLKSIFPYIFIVILSCSRSIMRDSIDMNWKLSNNIVDNNILLYEGYNPNVPMKAWAVIIPVKENRIKILVSEDTDGLNKPSEVGLKSGATVIINGGYFTRGKQPMRHIGLLKSKDSLYEPASNSVLRENLRYNTNRGAFAIKYDNFPEISWATTKNDSIFSWKFPFKNRPGKPASASINYSFSQFWNVKEAIHAGPILVTNETVNVTSEEEVFFNTPVDGVQPRSAIGYKKNGDIIMLVVDGRQVDSRGAYLRELAMLMIQFDCEEALNLDGGGSSSLIVNGKLINNPIGIKSEREVMSFIAAIPN